MVWNAIHVDVNDYALILQFLLLSLLYLTFHENIYMFLFSTPIIATAQKKMKRGRGVSISMKMECYYCSCSIFSSSSSLILDGRDLLVVYCAHAHLLISRLMDRQFSSLLPVILPLSLLVLIGKTSDTLIREISFSLVSSTYFLYRAYNASLSLFDC